MRRRTYPCALGLALLVPVFVVACGSARGSTGSSATTAHSATSASATNTVNVTLRDFNIAASQTTFTVGTRYHFVVQNAGANSHELMLMPPVNDAMGMGSTMGNLDKLALFMIPMEQLPPGATQTYDYTFTQAEAAEKLEFACHVEDHYQMGMHLPIMVR
jgi:uncharacterized cupredoxin-like copper-binding protein